MSGDPGLGPPGSWQRVGHIWRIARLPIILLLLILAIRVVLDLASGHGDGGSVFLAMFVGGVFLVMMFF